MAKCYQYTADGYYAGADEDYGLLPNNSTYTAPPEQPWNHIWPQWTGNAWVMVDDHRERKEPLFDATLTQDSTDYWLPGDTYSTPARQMMGIGPLPKGAARKCPAKTAAELLAEAQMSKRGEIQSGYDAAVAASLTMPLSKPTEQDITIGAAAFAAEDGEGLAYVMQTHAARRDALLVAVDAAPSAADVQNMVVSYAV